MVIKNRCDRSKNTIFARILAYAGLATGFLVGLAIDNNSVGAQVTSDGTVGTEVKVNAEVAEITGGTRADNNLFHSFQDFSVATDNTAFFNNATDIANIISRVTGANISNIDGLIRANGDANLILINPQGINFGANARLDLGGSFLGSTADKVIFEDGSAFSAQNTQLQPILTVTAPVGLQLGQNSASIQVQGGGLDAGSVTSDLSVTSGNTLSLIGNGITLNGGVIALDSGKIDFGSVAVGEVGIDGTETGWQLDYEGVTQFANLELAASNISVSNSLNNLSGEINLQGQNITLERSQIIAQTSNHSPGANIKIDGAASLSLSGTADSNGSQIVNRVETTAIGNGGDIIIETDRLNIRDLSLIASTTSGLGKGGDVEISAADINITGTGFPEFQQTFQTGVIAGTLTPEDLGTGIFLSTIATGKGGDLTIDAESLNLKDGAIIFSPVFTEGMGGDININAQNIDVNASAIQMGTLGKLESSAAGNINLNTQRLKIGDGGTIINSTLGNAPTGDINIAASESIAIADTPFSALVLSGIYANTLGTATGGDIIISTAQLSIIDGLISSNTGGVIVDGTIIETGGKGGNIDLQVSDTIEASGIPDNPALTSGIGTSSFSNADAGNLSISTNKLIIKEGADFSTATLGIGQGGQLIIDATESIELIGVTTTEGLNIGGLLATSGRTEFPNFVATGTSGDIQINTSSFTVRDGASVDVQSLGVGDAGSLNINADNVTLNNRANLSASTQSGAGGDIEIAANNMVIDRSLIDASVTGDGRGGKIKIAAQDSVVVNGSGFEFIQNSFFAPNILSPEFLDTLNFSLLQEGILAATTGSGQAGTIEINANDLEVKNGGLIGTATAGEGAASSILLNVAESIEISGSIISASSIASGRGGNIEVETVKLEVLEGGQITSSTLNDGDGGNLTINADESIKVSGTSLDNTFPSNISAGAQPLASATGNGGDLTIATADLEISDRGAVSVGSVGTGNAGTLTINADSINLDRQGVIAADTRSGKGGNIILEADDIIWQGNSFTTANAGANGDGGNITINADNLIVLENSQIIANAFLGTGGNIEIDTQGLLTCTECRIDASSQLGVDGQVEIETLQPSSQLDVLNLPQQLTQSNEAVVLACPTNSSNAASQLQVLGRGGLAPSPQEPLSSDALIAADATTTSSDQNSTKTKTSLLPPPAQSWYVDQAGTVVLSAQLPNQLVNNSPQTTVNCQK